MATSGDRNLAIDRSTKSVVSPRGISQDAPQRAARQPSCTLSRRRHWADKNDPSACTRLGRRSRDRPSRGRRDRPGRGRPQRHRCAQVPDAGGPPPGGGTAAYPRDANVCRLTWFSRFGMRRGAGLVRASRRRYVRWVVVVIGGIVEMSAFNDHETPSRTTRPHTSNDAASANRHPSAL